LRRQAARGFTLIEMIGVLAVIAILAALLIPKVFSAVNQARVNGVTVSLETVKTAIVDHYGRYGTFDSQFGTNSILASFSGGVSTGYDTNVLMIEGLLDKPFLAAIATTNAEIQLCQGGPSGTGKENGGTPYQLGGIGAGSTANATYVLQAKLTGVSVADAKDLNDRIDRINLGIPVGAPVGSTADVKGRVQYANPSTTGGSTTVYIYLTSR
jgi:prepilin-type N-terminal cleavage/methylation domain-containing protein